MPSQMQSTQTVAKPGVSLAIVAVIACVAQFMVVLDSSIVNVALPSMKAGLGLSVDAQQWVVDGYLIAFGGLLLLASRASDLFGRRRVFQIGLVVFTAASLLGGLAQDGVMLLAARLVQRRRGRARPRQPQLDHCQPHRRRRTDPCADVVGGRGRQRRSGRRRARRDAHRLAGLAGGVLRQRADRRRSAPRHVHLPSGLKRGRGPSAD
jgi:Major Facilitator Superfamily